MAGAATHVVDSRTPYLTRPPSPRSKSKRPLTAPNTAQEFPRLDTLTIRRVSLISLHHDPANARSHDERNLDAIAASLKQFGQAEPLVVQRLSGKVIGGNGRMTAMKALGWTECDVVELDLDDTQATALGIALNRTGELAEWDLPALTKILESFKGTEVFDALGFDEKELNAMLDEVIAAGESLDEIVEDGAPALPDAATTCRGGLWGLGDQRGLCGDSSKWGTLSACAAARGSSS